MHDNITQTTEALMTTLSKTFSARSVQALATMTHSDENMVTQILKAMQELPCFHVEATNGGRIRKVKLNPAAIGYAGEETNLRTGDIVFYKNGAAVHMMNDREHTSDEVGAYRRQLATEASNERLIYVDQAHTGNLVASLVRSRIKDQKSSRTTVTVH